MKKETILKLIDMAETAMLAAYAPYSHYQVGAALLCADGTIYTGCNIENAAYTPSNCAERTAFFKATSEGEREFRAIAIIGGPDGVPRDLATPCGVCRQVMMEFCEPEDFVIILAKSRVEYELSTLAELLPRGFGPKDLNV